MKRSDNVTEFDLLRRRFKDKTMNEVWDILIRAGEDRSWGHKTWRKTAEMLKDMWNNGQLKNDVPDAEAKMLEVELEAANEVNAGMEKKINSLKKALIKSEKKAKGQDGGN